MASGIVGVEPLEQPGTFRASLAGGGSMLVHGQPGADLYERFKPKPEALGPDALASNGPRMGTTVVDEPRAQPETVSDVPQNPSVERLPGGGVRVPISQARAMSRGERVLEPGPEGQGAQPVPQPAAPEPRQSGPRSLGYAMKGIDPVTGKEVQGEAIDVGGGNIAIKVAGSRGTPGGLTSLGKDKLEHTKAAEFQYANQSRIATEAHQEGVELAKREADERAGYLEESRQRAADAVKQQQDEQASVERRVSEIQSKYDKARDDFMDSKVDPDEYMKRNGGAVGMFSALGVALAQFGGAFTGQPNVAMQFVNSQIDRSIRAQEAQINVKGKAADNMLADLTREMGSLSSAKLAMRQLLTERSAIEMQQIGSSTKSQQIQSLATETSARAAAQAALLDNERKQATVKEAFTNPIYYRQGRAGSAPRIALPTQEAYQSGAANERANIGSEIDQRKSYEAAQGKDSGSALSEKEKSFLQTATATRAKVEDFIISHGGQINRETGEITKQPDLPVDLPGRDTETTAAAKSALTELGSMYANMNNAGAEAGQPTKEALTPKLGLLTDSQTQGALAQMYKGTKISMDSFAETQQVAKVKSDLARMPPTQRAAYVERMSPGMREKVLGK